MNHLDIFERIARKEGAEYLAAAAERAKKASPENARRLFPAMLQFLNHGSAKIAREARRDTSIDAVFPSASDAELIINIASSAMMRRAAFEEWAQHPEWLLLFDPVRDNLTCRAALKLVGRVFKQETAPRPPLSCCTKPFCRCSFIAMSPELCASWRRQGLIP